MLCASDDGADLPSDIGSHNLLAALRTHTSRHVFDNDQIPFDPEILFDLLLNHLIAANLTFSVIVISLAHKTSQAVMNNNLPVSLIRQITATGLPSIDVPTIS